MISLLIFAKFQKYLLDWTVVGILFLLFWNVTQFLHPFERQFSSTDLSISHPFAHTQRVNDFQLYILAVAIPSVVIFVTAAFVSNLKQVHERWHLIHVSLLGLWLTLVLTCVVTDILKCWIACPRPDFLERCGLSLPLPMLYTIDSCTLPLGIDHLLDGLKSSPSGHLSLAFAGLGFLALWLSGQFKVLHSLQTRQNPIWRTFILLGIPLATATYIALSRVQDYRHHPIDVALGSALGGIIAHCVYRRYFPSTLSQESFRPHAT